MRIFIQLIHEGWWFCFLSGAATLACLACWCGLGAVMSVARGFGRHDCLCVASGVAVDDDPMPPPGP